MFFGISKKQLVIESRLNGNGIDEAVQGRNRAHRYRYPLAPAGRPPDMRNRRRNRYIDKNNR